MPGKPTNLKPATRTQLAEVVQLERTRLRNSARRMAWIIAFVLAWIGLFLASILPIPGIGSTGPWLLAFWGLCTVAGIGLLVRMLVRAAPVRKLWVETNWAASPAVELNPGDVLCGRMMVLESDASSLDLQSIRSEASTRMIKRSLLAAAVFCVLTAAGSLAVGLQPGLQLRDVAQVAALLASASACWRGAVRPTLLALIVRSTSEGTWQVCLRYVTIRPAIIEKTLDAATFSGCQFAIARDRLHAVLDGTHGGIDLLPIPANAMPVIDCIAFCSAFAALTGVQATLDAGLGSDQLVVLPRPEAIDLRDVHDS